MTLVTLSRVEHGQLGDYAAKLRYVAIALERGDRVVDVTRDVRALADNLESLALAFQLREQAAR